MNSDFFPLFSHPQVGLFLSLTSDAHMYRHTDTHTGLKIVKICPIKMGSFCYEEAEGKRR